jgi:two-component system sensor histidine kinase KdpD
VITGEPLLETLPRDRQENHAPVKLWRYLVATLLIGTTLLLAYGLQALLQLPDPEMLFLFGVMLTASWFGRGPSLWAAALGVACYDFFFVHPYHTFSVTDRRYFLTFATMFGVGWALSELTGRLKRQEQVALFREERTTVLYTLSRDLASTDTPEKIAQAAAHHAADVFSAQAILLRAGQNGEMSSIGAAPLNAVLDTKELGVAKWTFEHGELAGHGTDTLPGSKSVCAPLRAGTSALGVLALILPEKTVLHAEQRAFLDVFCRQVAVTLERARLAEEARSSALRVKAEEMRSSLLSAVSHDLRTPLASITGAATSLRDDTNLDHATRYELVTSICEEAERLERLVTNLLDMTRLDSGGLTLKRDWVPLDEIISSALTYLESHLGERKINVQLTEDLPLLWVDPVLFEQLFVNLLENAGKYTPAGTPIEIEAHREPKTVIIEVSDHGPGIPEGTEEKIFDKFYRGSNIGVPGVGLGLPICRGIAEAHQASIRAGNRLGGGAVFRITIPMEGEPPPIMTSGEGVHA